MLRSPGGDLLLIIVRHPRVDRTVLLATLDRVAELLHQPDARPYAAAIALAQRTELHPDEIRTIAHLPGASRRMRRALSARLTARNTPPSPP